MSDGRLSPFDLVFAELANEQFPAIQEAFAQQDAEVMDRDAFLMNRAAVSLVHQLRPDEGLGAGVDQLASLVHQAYLYWRHGGWTFRVGRDTIIGLLATGTRESEARPRAYYLQMPHGLLWGQLGEGEPHQPLDGCFVAWGPGSRVQTLGVFGFHPDRSGFGVVEAGGVVDRLQPLPATPPPFTPAMDGGQQAGLYSVNHSGELVHLALLTAGRVTQAFTDVPEQGLHEVELP
jgi:hypothetical protein